MKRIFILAVIMAMVMGFSVQADAALFNRGTDTLGYRLIYDDVLGITWYDYTKSYDAWQNQVNWAGALDVDFGGTHYTDWRLPSTVDGQYVWGYDGTTTAGYNITTSEMGHLFYVGLGNKGYYDTSGVYVGDGNWGLLNTGDFQNLQPDYYWSGAEYAAGPIPTTRGTSTSATAARAWTVRAATTTPLLCVPAMYPPLYRNLAPCS